MRAPSTDKENYRFHIISCCLYVKLVTLTDPVYRSMKERLDKEKLLYQYRRLSMKQDVINQNSIIYESGNLFPDSTAPLRIFFMIVKNSSVGKDYSTNPFNFSRSVHYRSLPFHFLTALSVLQKKTAHASCLTVLMD